MNLSNRFFKYHKENNTFSESKNVLVAFSGGKDSLCLLEMLCEHAENFNLNIGACHVHHMIRGKEADCDLDFCRDYCQNKRIPFYWEKVDVPAFCKEKGIGLEEGARLERYRILESIAKREGFDTVATAHSASDQAETVLFRLIRGSGISGTKGIPKQRGIFIRPLLPFYQEEIIAYLQNKHLLFTKDSSNSDILYARNRLRNIILPEMMQINPSVEKALVRFGTLSSYQDALCRKLCDQIEKAEGFHSRDGKAPLSLLSNYTKEEADYPLLYEFVSRMAQNENISIDFDHFLSLVSLLKCPFEGKIIEISRGFAFVIQNDTLCFAKYESSHFGIEYEMRLKEGDNALPIFSELLHVSEKKEGKVVNINKKALIIHLSSDRIKGELVARSFRDGDTIRMYGMTKKIKKMLCDADIPKALRDRIPMICDEEEVIWVPFFGLCDKVRDENAETVRTLTLSGEALFPIEEIVGKGAFNTLRNPR